MYVTKPNIDASLDGLKRTLRDKFINKNWETRSFNEALSLCRGRAYVNIIKISISLGLEQDQCYSRKVQH